MHGEQQHGVTIKPPLMPSYFNPIVRSWRCVALAMIGLAGTAVGWSAPKPVNLELKRYAVSPAMQAAAGAAKMA